MKYLLIILALAFISCSRYSRFESFTGSYHNPDFYTPSRNEVLELYITIPYGDEVQRTLYLHTYWDDAAHKNISSTGFWHMIGKSELEFWDWKPYPGDTAISDCERRSLSGSERQDSL
jgi:hypothetical protein